MENLLQFRCESWSLFSRLEMFIARNASSRTARTGGFHSPGMRCYSQTHIPFLAPFEGAESNLNGSPQDQFPLLRTVYVWVEGLSYRHLTPSGVKSASSFFHHFYNGYALMASSAKDSSTSMLFHGRRFLIDFGVSAAFGTTGAFIKAVRPVGLTSV